jgi:hypothetical protein
VRFLTRHGLVFAIVAVAAGCGANSKQTLSAGDLRRIAAVRPMMAGWTWPQKPIHERRTTESCDGWRWQDEHKLGVTYACLAESETAAHRGLAGARAFARGWAERTVGGGSFTDVALEGLGDEAWRIKEDFSGGQEVTFGWRRARLLLQVHIQCIFQPCQAGDIRRAGRAWADAIDREARTRGRGSV